MYVSLLKLFCMVRPTSGGHKQAIFEVGPMPKSCTNIFRCDFAQPLSCGNVRSLRSRRDQHRYLNTGSKRNLFRPQGLTDMTDMSRQSYCNKNAAKAPSQPVKSNQQSSRSCLRNTYRPGVADAILVAKLNQT